MIDHEELINDLCKVQAYVHGAHSATFIGNENQLYADAKNAITAMRLSLDDLEARLKKKGVWK